MAMPFPFLIAGALAIGLSGAAIGLGVGAVVGYYYFAPNRYAYPVPVYPPYYGVPPPIYPGYW